MKKVFVSFALGLSAVLVAGAAMAQSAVKYDVAVGWVDGDESYGSVVQVSCPSFKEVVVGLSQRIRVQCDKAGDVSVTNLVRGHYGAFVPASVSHESSVGAAGQAESALRGLRDKAEVTLAPHWKVFKSQ